MGHEISELDRAIQNYQSTRKDYVAIEQEWLAKKSSQSSRFPFPEIFRTKDEEFERLKEERKKRETALNFSRNRVTSHISFEPGKYSFEALEYHRTLKSGTFITMFQYSLEDGELLHVRKPSTQVSIKRNPELQTYEVEIASQQPPIIHTPSGHMNLAVEGKVRIVDVSDRTYISIEDLHGTLNHSSK